MVALVVLPGLDATGTLHDEFLEAARRDFDAAWVLAYPRAKLGYDQLEAWVRARLPDDRPFVLLGESFSGPVAQAVAARPPRGLRGLVLSTSFASHPVRTLAPFAPLLHALPLPLPPMRVLAPLLLGRWTTASLERALHAAIRSVPANVLRHRAATALRCEGSPLLPRIAVPTLCLRATDDRLLPRDCAVRIAASIPQCVVRDIEGPHLLLQAAAGECARVVGDFANRIARSPAPAS